MRERENEISKGVIGAAMTVLNELKPGLDEKLYENALKIDLEARGFKVDQQKSFEVKYRGTFIGRLIPDMIVNDLVVVDPKVVTEFNQNHVAQMMGYLNITGLNLALLLNVKYAELKIKRVVN